MNLAAAGQLDLGRAAEIAASAMTQFGLKGKDVGHVSDLLAAGAGKAQGEVTDMAAALAQSGLVAAQTGLTIEEASGALAGFASGAIQTALIGSTSSANGLLRTLTQGATAAVDAYSALPGPLQAAATGSVAVAGGFLLVGGAALIAVPKIAAYREAVDGATGRTAMLAGGLSRVGGLLTGPLGAALAFGTIALTLYGNERAKTRQRVEEFTEAVKADSGAIGENTRKLAVNSLEKAGALRLAQKMGIDLRTVTEAALGNASAIALLTVRTDAYYAAANNQGASEIAGGYSATADEVGRLRSIVLGTADATDSAVAAAKRQTEALGPNAAGMGTAAGAADTLGGAQDQVKSKTDAANKALRDQLDQVRAAYDPVFAMGKALDQHRQAQENVAEAVKKYGKNSTETRQAELDLLEATLGLDGASRTLNTSLSTGATSVDAMRAQMSVWADQGLITQGQAQTIAAQLDVMAGKARTVSQTPAYLGITTNAPQVLDGVERKLQALNNRELNVYVNVLAVGGGKLSPAILNRADGGVVDFYGSGGIRENRVAQIAPAGAWRVWAEPETGGEAYIPFAQSKRGRSVAVWAEAGRRLGVMGEQTSTSTSTTVDRSVNIGSVTLSGQDADVAGLRRELAWMMR